MTTKNIKSNDNEYLGTAPVSSLLFKLALPCIVAQLINMLYNLVDRIYIGHIPEVGNLALTGVGVCMPIIMIVSAFAALVSMGGATKASIAMGAKDNDQAEHVLGNSTTVLLIISFTLTVILLIFNRPLLNLFGASPNTIKYALDYLNIYSIGTVFVLSALGLNPFISAQGFAKTSMLSILIGAVINIILDPILIFGLNMGVKGAALATIISQGISCLWIVYFLTSKKTIIKIKKSQMKIDVPLTKACLLLGVSSFVMQASESVVSVCFNSSLLKYGGDIAVGSMTILTSLIMFVMLPLQGLSQGANPIISYNYGANNKERVKKTFKLELIISTLYTMIFVGLVMIVPEMFASIFSDSAELINFAASAMKIFFLGMFFFGVQITCQQTFVALGKAKASIIVAVTRKFILLIPLIFILPRIFTANKVNAVFIAEPISDTISIIVTVILFIKVFSSVMHEMDNERAIPTSK